MRKTKRFWAILCAVTMLFTMYVPQLMFSAGASDADPTLDDGAPPVYAYKKLAQGVQPTIGGSQKYIMAWEYTGGGNNVRVISAGNVADVDLTNAATHRHDRGQPFPTRLGFNTTTYTGADGGTYLNIDPNDVAKSLWEVRVSGNESGNRATTNSPNTPYVSGTYFTLYNAAATNVSGTTGGYLSIIHPWSPPPGITTRYDDWHDINRGMYISSTPHQAAIGYI